VDLFYVVDVSDTTDDPTGTSKQITRDEILQNITGLTATTISATTYQNLPVDPNYYTTAFTYSNNVFTISQSGQSDLTATINSVTGWTVNGNLTVTGNTSLQGVTATTISATTISATTYYGSGTNLTGVVKGAGTTNYLPKWTGTTGLGNSIIQDDGTNVGIGLGPQSGYKLYVGGSIYGSGSIGTYGVDGRNIGDITGTYVGVYGEGTSVEPYVDSIYVGGKFLANGSLFNLNYAAWLQDGTEGLNKVLISATADGKTNWSSSLSGLTTVIATTISGGTVSGGTMVITSTPTTDNTVTQVLSRDPSTGTVELTDISSLNVAFNYGLANAIMTGNFLT